MRQHSDKGNTEVLKQIRKGGKTIERIIKPIKNQIKYEQNLSSIKAVEFFKTHENAKAWTAEHPEFKFKNQEG